MPPRYRVGYVGNFQPDLPAGVAPWSTETHVAFALEACGHEVVRVQENHVDWRTLPERAAAGAWDWLLWTRTWELDVEAQSVMLAGLREFRIPTVAFHLDKYWDIDREEQIRRLPWWRCDVVFSADGGNQERFAAAGIDHVWCPPGVHGPECQPGGWRAEYECDVAFVGSPGGRYHREWPFRGRLIEWLDQRYGGRFKLVTGGLRGRQLNDFYASARIIVGDTLNVGPGGVPFAGSRYWSDRAPETVGRGGFLLMPHVEGLERDFVDGEHLRLWQHGDLDQLAALIHAYVGDRSERDRIRMAGQQHARHNLSYEARLRNLILPELRQRFPRLRGPADWIDAQTQMERCAVREVAVDNVYRIDPARDLAGWVVDVGASIGELALWALDYGPASCRILAVEPREDALTRLVRSAGQAGVAGRVAAFHGIVAGHDGSASMSDDGLQSVAQRAIAGPLQAVTLDKLFADFGVDEVACLKLDVEGAEADILLGCSDDALRRCRYITFEWHGTGTGHTPQPDGLFGAVVERLARTHKVTTLGDPRAGGYVYARRFA